MFCPHCGSNTKDGLKFCEECGAPLDKAAGMSGSDAPKQRPGATEPVAAAAPAEAGKQRPSGQPASFRQEPTVHHSSDKEKEGEVTKPNFVQQTAYRIETFKQGPDKAPDPSEPLPLTSPSPEPAQGAGQTKAHQPAQGAANSKKSPGKGCKIGAITVVAIIVLLFAFSCSMMGQCASSVSDQSGRSNTSQNTTSNANATTTSPATSAKSSEETWTVLFYLCGSNLESEAGLATVNLQELANADLGDKVTFVVETGGSKRWQNSTVDPRYLTRYAVSGKGFFEEQKLPAASMSTASTFADFVSWGVKNHPADHYMLVMWDHGGGSVYGVCQDELFDNAYASQSDTLTLSEMSEGLKQAGVKFDVIGFDTCLMGSFETAATLAPYADYLVASEEVEPGTGWDYVAWPEWLATHTGASGDQLGAEICDSYFTKCKKYRAQDMATLSVIDLSKISKLYTSFRNASNELMLATSDTKAMRDMYRASTRTVCFGGDSQYNMVDLGDLMRNMQSVAPEYYDDVIADVQEAVVYQVHGRSRANVSGLSVFYPLDTRYSQEFYGYLDVAANVPYAQFTSVMFGLYNKVDWDKYADSVEPQQAPIEESGISISYAERVNDEGRLELQITDGLEDVAQVTVELAILLEDEKAVVYLGTDYNIWGSYSTGVFSDNFYGRWMAIDDNWVSAVLYEAGDDYTMYYIPVLLNGESTNLIARYDFNTGTYEVLCSCPVIDESNMSPKEMRALEEGDVIEFQFVAYFLDTEETVTFEMGEVVWSDDVVMEDVDLGPGGYLYRFQITDVLGEVHDTDLYVQHYQEDGYIYVKELADYLVEIGFEL